MNEVVAQPLPRTGEKSSEPPGHTILEPWILEPWILKGLLVEGFRHRSVAAIKQNGVWTQASALFGLPLRLPSEGSWNEWR